MVKKEEEKYDKVSFSLLVFDLEGSTRTDR